MTELDLLMRIGELQEQIRELESEGRVRDGIIRELRDAVEEGAVKAFSNLSARLKLLEDKQSG